jgi:CHC2 zinc finger
VRLLALDERRRIAIGQLERELPPQPASLSTITAPRRARAAPIDALRSVAPAVYVERLTGQRVGRSRKVRCPFHEDQTPSLHVYDDPERGWYCFGCAQGGSIYDLAALLWQRQPRGADFVELRRELEALII